MPHSLTQVDRLKAICRSRRSKELSASISVMPPVCGGYVGKPLSASVYHIDITNKGPSKKTNKHICFHCRCFLWSTYSTSAYSCHFIRCRVGLPFAFRSVLCWKHTSEILIHTDMIVSQLRVCNAMLPFPPVKEQLWGVPNKVTCIWASSVYFCFAVGLKNLQRHSAIIYPQRNKQ